MSQRVVINTCFGGFGLSPAALDALSARKGDQISESKIARDDADLVAVVEQMGEKASGHYAHLVIVEIPDGVSWEIAEYDGNEHLAEQHRTWR